MVAFRYVFFFFFFFLFGNKYLDLAGKEPVELATGSGSSLI